MATYTVAHAQENLPDLLERAGRGEAIVVANDQGVKVKLTLVHDEAATVKRRKFGRYKGKMTLSDDIFEPVMSDEDYEAWMSKL